VYNDERRPKSRPNELAFAPFNIPKGIERIGTHRSKDRVFRLSPETISLFCMLIVFFDRASSKANSPSLLHFVHQRLSIHPKSSNHSDSGNLDHHRCGELILRLLVAFGLWVFVMHHISALFSMCHWFFVMLYLAGDHVVPSRRSPLYVTKSSDEGQIMLPSGRSPLYATKSSDEGQIMFPSGRSPLYETKSSNERQIMLA